MNHQHDLNVRDERIAELEAENKLMKDKALIAFGCFWNGGWYEGKEEEALWREEEL